MIELLIVSILTITYVVGVPFGGMFYLWLESGPEGDYCMCEHIGACVLWPLVLVYLLVAVPVLLLLRGAGEGKK